MYHGRALQSESLFETMIHSLYQRPIMAPNNPLLGYRNEIYRSVNSGNFSVTVVSARTEYRSPQN
jgi:hypothetical protein